MKLQVKVAALLAVAILSGNFQLNQQVAESFFKFMLTAALATAANVFGAAVEAGGDCNDVRRTIFVTTLLSALTIGALSVLFH